MKRGRGNWGWRGSWVSFKKRDCSFLFSIFCNMDYGLLFLLWVLVFSGVKTSGQKIETWDRRSCFLLIRFFFLRMTSKLASLLLTAYHSAVTSLVLHRQRHLLSSLSSSSCFMHFLITVHLPSLCTAVFLSIIIAFSPRCTAANRLDWTVLRHSFSAVKPSA